MKILMIAPEPFFEPRGTPFSEYHRIRALTGLGHTVDLVTYPFGQDVTLSGLRIIRCLRPPFIHRVRIGPSWSKVALDIALAIAVFRRAIGCRYDAIHSHEEGAAIGVVVAALVRRPHLYDMHSSLPQQLTNFAFSRSRLLRWLFERLERCVIRRSRVVVVICPYLQGVVRGIDAGARVVLIENAPGSGDAPASGSGTEVRREFGLDSSPVVLYTGTFEAYQGLDLLFAAAARVVQSRPRVRFLLAGGKPAQVARARMQVVAMGIDGAVAFAGERPADRIPAFLDAADVLVSPRSIGTNTPLKIYQYLRSGRPIVATRLLTHTQVLDDEVAELTEATPDGFAGGIVRVLDDPARARALAENAQRLASTRYSEEAYVERTREACDALVEWEGRKRPREAGSR